MHSVPDGPPASSAARIGPPADPVGAEGVFLLDSGGTIRTWSPAAEACTGLSAGEAVGQPISTLYTPPDAAQGLPLRDLAEARRAGYLRGERTIRGAHAEFLAELTVHHLAPGGGPAEFAIVLRDGSAEPRMAARQDGAMRVEALGHVAGAVAHDFNNLLMIVVRCCEHLLEAPGLEPEHRTELEQIALAADHGAALASQLLALTGRTHAEPHPIDLAAAVSQTLRLLRRPLGDRIAVRSVPGAEPAWVRMHEGEVGQVLINLAINARDAMPDGGVLTVTTGRLTLDEAGAARRGLAAGTYVTLQVGDSGFGMTEDVRARAFERFFSTKPAGRGTGLGLASVADVVRMRHGAIEMRSEPGEGTEVTILLPLVSPDAGRLPARGGDAPVQRARPGERVLVVEDDPVVRDIVGSILRELGYETAEACSGADALARAGAGDRPFDLLVTDLALPDIPGEELAGRMAEACPATKVLFISGYADQAAPPAHDTAGAPFLQKPFSGRVLGRKVREVLDAPAPAPRG